MGAIYLVIGILAGLVMAIGTALGGNADNAGAAIALLFFIVIVPVLYAIGGFLGGMVLAALYNFVAPKVGGLELELEPRGPQY